MVRGEEKQRRMAARKATGNRKPSATKPRLPAQVARYLVAHACFECRKCFKLDPDGEHRCPTCRRKLLLMGRSFRSPARDNREQWQKVQMLYAYGFRFVGYRRGGERLPQRLRDVGEFVKRNPKHPLRVAPPDFTFLPNHKM